MAASLPLATAQTPDAETARWLSQLDSPHYEQRTKATEHLIGMGATVIPALEKAVKSGSLEVRTRALYVLQEIAMESDDEAETLATKALGRIAHGSGSLASKARDVLQRIEVMREKRAITRLTALGARFGAVREPVFSREPALIVDSAQWHGNDTDLDMLAYLRDVRTVQLVGPRVNNTWIRAAAKIPNLNYLMVKHASRIGNDALEPLTNTSTLQYLDLFYTPVDDGCLDLLAELRNQLMGLRLYGTKVTRAGWEKLIAGLPAPTSRFDYKRGAFLGVQCSTESSFLCQVVSVTEGSAAFRARIRTNDVLIQYGKHPIGSFDDLKAHIAENVPGDKEKLKLLRQATEVMFYITPPKQVADLGLTVKPHILGLLVTGVEKGKVADRAGIKKGDILYAAGGKRATSLEGILDALRKVAEAGIPQPQPVPGGGGFGPQFLDPAGIAGLRGYREVEVEVRFGEW